MRQEKVGQAIPSRALLRVDGRFSTHADEEDPARRFGGVTKGVAGVKLGKTVPHLVLTGRRCTVHRSLNSK